MGSVPQTPTRPVTTTGLVTQAELESALRQLEAQANQFAIRLIRMADVRTDYVRKIHEYSQSIRTAVANGELSEARGAQLAHEMRNQIMEMSRRRDMDLGRSLARDLKGRGLSFEEAIERATRKLGFQGRPFQSLSGTEQRRVYLEVIESAGRSRPSVTGAVPRLRVAARGLWIASLLVAGYNIGTSENPWWQTGREASSIAGGFGGGFAGGAAMGAVGGAWAGPIGVGIGIIVGGVLGALLADHAYVEIAGASNPATRNFIGRFTGFWTGTDESGMAKALATEYANNAFFVQQVFESLESDYSTDADDVALEYVEIARRNVSVRNLLRQSPPLRQTLIRLLDDGWTSKEEAEAIQYLKGLAGGQS